MPHATCCGGWGTSSIFWGEGVLSSCRAVGTTFFGLSHAILNDQYSPGYTVVTYWIIERAVRAQVQALSGWQGRSRWWGVRCLHYFVILIFMAGI